MLCACGVALANAVPKRSKLGSDGGGGEGLLGRGGGGERGERGGRGTETEGRAGGGGGLGGGSPKGKSPAVRLIEEPDCKEDIERICRDNPRNNFAVLECLQNDRVGVSQSFRVEGECARGNEGGGGFSKG